MSGQRMHFTVGLVLVMCTLTGHCARSAPSVALLSAADGDAQRDYRGVVEIVRHVEDRRGRHRAITESPVASRVQTDPMEPKDLRTVKTGRMDRAAVSFPKDLRKKEKFINHITGPLYFSPKCKKQVYRLVLHTRDCTVPGYFKRCARLLTRLASSLQCTEG